MLTQTIKDEVKKHAPNDRCIWPNGLGFSYRGWEYSFGNGVAQNWAARRGDKVGRGATPDEAKANARPVVQGAFSHYFHKG